MTTGCTQLHNNGYGGRFEKQQQWQWQWQWQWALVDREQK
jgi:hypothetical protein